MPAPKEASNPSSGPENAVLKQSSRRPHTRSPRSARELSAPNLVGCPSLPAELRAAAFLGRLTDLTLPLGAGTRGGVPTQTGSQVPSQLFTEKVYILCVGSSCQLVFCKTLPKEYTPRILWPVYSLHQTLQNASWWWRADKRIYTFNAPVAPTRCLNPHLNWMIAGLLPVCYLLTAVSAVCERMVEVPLE